MSLIEYCLYLEYQYIGDVRAIIKPSRPLDQCNLMYVLFCYFILLFLQTFSADEFTKRKALSYKGEKRIMDLIIFLNGFLLKNYVVCRVF